MLKHGTSEGRMFEEETPPEDVLEIIDIFRARFPDYTGPIEGGEAANVIINSKGQGFIVTGKECQRFRKLENFMMNWGVPVAIRKCRQYGDLVDKLCARGKGHAPLTIFARLHERFQEAPPLCWFRVTGIRFDDSENNI